MCGHSGGGDLGGKLGPASHLCFVPGAQGPVSSTCFCTLGSTLLLNLKTVPNLVSKVPFLTAVSICIPLVINQVRSLFP